MNTTSRQIEGYDYGSPSLEASPVTLHELELLKQTVGWSSDDEKYLRLAGEVLAEQARVIVDHWRLQIISNIPHLARHSKTPEGEPLPDYAARSGARFEQWIRDTCLRAYDQDWLNYQHQIALRHMEQKKNLTDGVRSTAFVPLRYIIAFIPVMNETIKGYLAAKGHSAMDIEKMHLAWCKSLQLQMSLWTRSYMEPKSTHLQW